MSKIGDLILLICLLLTGLMSLLIFFGETELAYVVLHDTIRGFYKFLPVLTIVLTCVIVVELAQRRRK